MADNLVVSEGQVTSPQNRLCTCFETEQKYRIILERLPFLAECHGNKSTSGLFFLFPPTCNFLHVNLMTTLSDCYENLHTD